MIDIDDFYNSTVELNKNESESSPNNLKWSQTMFGSIDPIELYGNEVKVFRKVLESHKDVSWDSIIPIIDKDLDRGHVRILDPKANTYATHNPQYIQIDEEMRWEIPPETQQWMYGFVLHSVKSYPDELKKLFLEAKEKFKINHCHTYCSLSTRSTLLNRHDDLMSVLIVAGLGEVEYEFDDGKKYTINPGDAIYIPRKTYHKPKIFGSRITFSYCWTYDT